MTSDKLRKLGWSCRTLEETIEDTVQFCQGVGFLEDVEGDASLPFPSSFQHDLISAESIDYLFLLGGATLFETWTALWLWCIYCMCSEVSWVSCVPVIKLCLLLYSIINKSKDLLSPKMIQTILVSAVSL